MATVHLDMVELEGNRKSGFEQPFAILAPHHHGIAKLVGVLIDDAIQFRLYHGGGADDHAIVKHTAFTIIRNLGGQ